MPRLPRHDRLAVVVSPMAVWALHLGAVSALVWLHCGAPPARQPQIGADMLGIGLAAATVLALALIGALGVLGWRGWQLDNGGGQPQPEARRQRRRFLGMVLFVLAILAAVATLLTTVPVLMVGGCL